MTLFNVNFKICVLAFNKSFNYQSTFAINKIHGKCPFVTQNAVAHNITKNLSSSTIYVYIFLCFFRDIKSDSKNANSNIYSQNSNSNIFNHIIHFVSFCRNCVIHIILSGYHECND